MKLKAKDTKTFSISKKKTPSKVSQYVARVIAKSLNVRDWAGEKNDKVSFSPLKMGDRVLVCDAILSDDRKTWYYINFNGKYGFVNASYLESVPKKALKFIGYLENYHIYVKHNGSKFEYRFDGNLTTWQKVKNRIAKGGIAGITCVVPCRLALKALGINPSGFWAQDGTFKYCYRGVIKENLTRITKGGAVGLTIKQAVDKGVLPIGAICAFKGRTHTFVYSGDKYYVYDGGHAAIKDGKYTGVKVDYSVKNKNCVISEYLVWKE